MALNSMKLFDRIVKPYCEGFGERNFSLFIVPPSLHETKNVIFTKNYSVSITPVYNSRLQFEIQIISLFDIRLHVIILLITLFSYLFLIER